MREINPADVPQMIKEGKLRFGSEIEFCDTPKFNTRIHIESLYGFSLANRDGAFQSKNGAWWKYARFPEQKRQSLRDGDPVVVWNYGGSLHRRHVKGFEHALNGKITTYPNGLSLWSDKDCDPTIWDCWRLPTKEELSKVGCSEAQITEMLTRWGIKQ